MRLRSLLLVTSCSLLFGACGGDEAPATAAASGPVSAADFLTRYPQTYCRTIAPCCAKEGVPYDEAYCLEREKLDDKFIAYTEPNGVAAYDPIGAGKCLDAIAAAGCAAQDDFDTPGCERVIVGLIPLGEKCFESFFCAPQAGKRVACTGIQSEDGPGICSLVTENLGAGEACDFDSLRCAEGLECVRADVKEPSSATCQPPPALGEPCSVECAPDARCDGSSRVCVPRIALGEPCAGDFVCVEPGFCDNFGSKLCTPLRKRGEACGLPFHCASGICEGGLCRDSEIRSCAGAIGGDVGPDAPPVGTGGPAPAPPG